MTRFTYYYVLVMVAVASLFIGDSQYSVAACLLGGAAVILADEICHAIKELKK